MSVTESNFCAILLISAKSDPMYRLYSSFSICNNTRQLVTYRSSKDIIECADGIRVISLLWVILIHTALWMHGREKYYDDNTKKVSFIC